MSQVSFDGEEQYSRPAIFQGPKGLTGLVIKMGMARDEAGATRLLLIAAAIAIGIGVGAPLVLGGAKQKMEAPPGYRIVTPPGDLPRLQKI